MAWHAVFSKDSANTPAPAPAAIAPTTGKTDWAAVFAASKAERAAQQAALTPTVSAVNVVAKPTLDAALWGELNKVNRKINTVLVRRSDVLNYGVEDFWATPISDGGPAYGDCEDYVLEKRKALIASGMPANALSAAIVTTAWGESHAVLLVDTDKGEYVLDNLSSFIVPWSKAGYVWRERQVAGDPFTWGMPGAPTSRAGLMSIASR